ncbi:SDR family oxidoreductase [Streptomyces sp. NPDC000878]
MLLLTGAMGFPGSRLCAELLHRTDRDVVCVVRAASAREAEERVRAALRAQAPQVAASRRLRCVAGDIARPRLGLDTAAHETLYRAVSEVHHCGASVNTGHGYDAAPPPSADDMRLPSEEDPPWTQCPGGGPASPTSCVGRSGCGLCGFGTRGDRVACSGRATWAGVSRGA